MVEGFCRPSVEAGSAAQRQAVQRRQRRLPTVVITKHQPSAGSAAQASVACRQRRQRRQRRS